MKTIFYIGYLFFSLCVILSLVSLVLGDNFNLRTTIACAIVAFGCHFLSGK